MHPLTGTRLAGLLGGGGPASVCMTSQAISHTFPFQEASLCGNKASLNAPKAVGSWLCGSNGNNNNNGGGGGGGGGRDGGGLGLGGGCSTSRCKLM